jgi:hypothetical protein
VARRPLREKAPFPWFGGKSRAAHLVWRGFGDVPNFVEPFAGSLAVLLGRPTAPRIETVNDLDCYLANFWRAVKFAPDQVAEHADWPVNEADLHARHRWLVAQDEFRRRMKREPKFFDAQVAGWWVWGLCQWIGGGWCANSNWDANWFTDRAGNERGSAIRRAWPVQPDAEAERARSPEADCRLGRPNQRWESSPRAARPHGANGRERRWEDAAHRKPWNRSPPASSTRRRV